jgi:mRNA interferase RelE/StbE
MRYRLLLAIEAREQLRMLTGENRRNVGHRLDALQNDLRGDVRKLNGREAKYRLRVGRFRVLFTLEQDLIFVYAVKDRKEAYD